MGNVIDDMLSVYGTKHQLTAVEKCYGENCVSIGYSIIGDSTDSDSYKWIDDIMENVANVNDLVYKQ